MFRHVNSSERMPNWRSATRIPKPVRSRIRSMPASTVLGLPINAVPLSIRPAAVALPPPSARRLLMKFFIEPIEV